MSGKLANGMRLQQLTDEGLPSVSVVIRSYHRVASLLRLIGAVLEQDYPSFEVIVVEQSGLSKLARKPLEDIMAQDPRLRVLYSKPLGPGGARNAGWRAVRNEIIVLIDDDDLPIGDRFVRRHAENYADPSIVAVTGRHVYSAEERCGYRNRRRARRWCLRYNSFGYPHAFCRFDERIDSVAWLHGTNASVRRSVVERVGGWEEGARSHDEHAFSLQLMKCLRPGERLVFDPSVVVLRNKDMPGGAGLRWARPQGIFEDWRHYFHNVAARHYVRWNAWWFLLVPFICWFLTLRWVWVDAKGYPGVAARARATLEVLCGGPFWYLRSVLGNRGVPSVAAHRT